MLHHTSIRYSIVLSFYGMRHFFRGIASGHALVGYSTCGYKLYHHTQNSLHPQSHNQQIVLSSFSIFSFLRSSSMSSSLKLLTMLLISLRDTHWLPCFNCCLLLASSLNYFSNFRQRGFSAARFSSSYTSSLIFLGVGRVGRVGSVLDLYYLVGSVKKRSVRLSWMHFSSKRILLSFSSWSFLRAMCYLKQALSFRTSCSMITTNKHEPSDH